MLFATAPASDVVVVSNAQVTCTSPAYYPSTVDVTVVNTDQSRAVSLNAFRFESTDVVLSLPSATGRFGSTVDIDLSAANLSALAAADVTVTYDSSVLAARGVQAGALANGWALAGNIGAPGAVRFSLAGSSTVTGSGVLARITFEVVGHPPASSALTITVARLNDGAMANTRTSGTFTVSGFSTITGTARYYSDDSPVNGAAVSLVGPSTFSGTSDEAGGFSLADVPTGAYVLTPRKSDDTRGISALDASLVLRHAVGLITLTGPAAVAADVNRNGTISSMDAFYILQRVVGMLDLPFPGAGATWFFDPPVRSYTTLNASLAGQDFTAMLLGDVTGNWATALDPPAGGGARARRAASGSGSPSTSDRTNAADATRDDSAGPTATLFAPRVLLTPGTSRTLPLTIRPVHASIHALQFAVHYDPNVVTLNGISTGAATAGWMLATNLETPGVARVAIAGAASLDTSGEVATLNVSVTGLLGSSTALTYEAVEADEGAVPTTTRNGSVQVVTTSLAFNSQLSAGATPVRAIHLTELRAAVDALRERYSLPAYPWTDPYLVAGVTTIKAVHVSDLRDALAEVYAVAGITPPTWSPAVLTPRATVITSAVFNEIRAAVLGLW